MSLKENLYIRIWGEIRKEFRVDQMCEWENTKSYSQRTLFFVSMEL